MSLKEKFENEIVPLFSLSKFDLFWNEALNGSLIVVLWLKIKLFVQKNLAGLSFLGTVCEITSFALVLVLFLILPAPMFADDKEKLALIVVAATSIRILGLLLSRKFHYKTCAVDMMVLAFALMNVIATASSYYPIQSLRGLSKMLVYFCSYFLFLNSLQQNTTKRSLMVISAMLGSAVLVALYGLYQYKIGVAPLATWEDPSLVEKTTRVYSTLKNPNLLAGYLLPMIPLSLGLAIAAFCAGGWKRYLALIAMGACGVLSVCTILTDCRGGFMGLGAGLAALGVTVLYSIWCTRPKWKPAIILFLLTLPLAIGILIHKSPRLEHRILSIFGGYEHSSNAYRLNVYVSSFKMFLDNWWIGVGPGNSTFKLVYGLYMRSGFDALGTYCVPLEVAVETGVMGLMAFVGMILSTLARAHENFWTNTNKPERWIWAGAAAGLVAMMIHGLVDTVYYRPQVQFIFWLLLALCIAKEDLGSGQAASASGAAAAVKADESESVGGDEPAA